jgi:HSP20 family protein
MNTQLTRKEDQAPAARPQEYVRPRYEVRGNDDAYFIDVTLPGVRREDARITLEGTSLRIEGQRPAVAAAGWQALYQEIPLADYRLQLELNVAVDANKISARAENGILTVVLPVAEAAKPRQITVE